MNVLDSGNASLSEASNLQLHNMIANTKLTPSLNKESFDNNYSACYYRKIINSELVGYGPTQSGVTTVSPRQS